MGDSIDLRKWSYALITYKFLILGLVVVAVRAATVISYLVQASRFESTAGAVLPPAKPEGGVGLSFRGYQELAASTAVIERMRLKLGLASAPGLVRNQLQASTDKEQGYISMTTSGKTAEEAFSLANQWLESYGEQVRDDIQLRLSSQKEEATPKVGSLPVELAAAQDALSGFDLENPLGVRKGRLSAMEQELANNETRLLRLWWSDAGVDPAVDAYLRAVMSDTPGALGGGGTPGAVSLADFGSPASNEANNPVSSSPVYIELSQSLVGARLSTLERELVQSEGRLRLLIWSSIPADEHRMIALEEALNNESSIIPLPKGSPLGEGEKVKVPSAGTPNPVYLQLSKDLEDATFSLSTTRSEADALERRIANLNGEVEIHRKQLAVGQAADELQIETERVAEALASNINFLRQETDAIRRQLEVDQQVRQELENEVQELQALYEPAISELDRLLELEAQLPKISSLSAISEPAMPTSPVSPQRARNIMLAGALGLMLGVFAALFLEFYRSTPSLPSGEE